MGAVLGWTFCLGRLLRRKVHTMWCTLVSQWCKLRGHKWAPIVVTKAGGEARRYCDREGKWIAVQDEYTTLAQNRREIA